MSESAYCLLLRHRNYFTGLGVYFLPIFLATVDLAPSFSNGAKDLIVPFEDTLMYEPLILPSLLGLK